MRPEMQHLLIVMVGAAHTLLCASKAQLNKAPSGLLQLQWTVSVSLARHAPLHFKGKALTPSDGSFLLSPLLPSRAALPII